MLCVRHSAQLLHAAVCDFKNVKTRALSEISELCLIWHKSGIAGAQCSNHLSDAALNFVKEPVVSCIQNSFFKKITVFPLQNYQKIKWDVLEGTYQNICRWFDELLSVWTRVIPVDSFPNETSGNILHGDEAIDAAPDGRVIPFKRCHDGDNFRV